MTPKDRILAELKNSAPILWQPGMSLSNSGAMTLNNANGTIDASTLGYQYTLQTTTAIRAKVIDMKLYKVPFADYVPVVVGENAWMESIKTNMVFPISGDFEHGLQNQAAQRAKFPRVNVGISPITQNINTWANSYDYTTFEVNKALASDNWDVVMSKMKAAKTVWDLGLQKVAFLGLKSDVAGTPGLLSQPNVTVDTTTMAANISSFTPAQYNTFIAGILGTFFANSGNTAMPTHLELPMNDFLGLGAFVAPTYATGTFIDVLQTAFSKMTGEKFTIYGSAYGQAANNAGFWTTNGTNRACLYRKDPDSVRMDIPVDFTLPAAVPTSSVQFEGVAYGQFSGVIAFRPGEMMYFDH